MRILESSQIRQKIKRLAIEILERNYGEKEIVLVGLNNNGVGFAQMLLAEIMPRIPSTLDVILTRIRLNPANPIEYPPVIEMPIEDLKGKTIVIVDDVANTGRTIFYAIQPLLAALPKKVEVVVLVDRQHKSFPINADYVGLSLATTLKENIDVNIKDPKNMSVDLV